MDKSKLPETVEQVAEFYKDDPTPVNPFYEKWKTEYPKEPCTKAGYSCMFCGDCPGGEYWKCPKEDEEEYNKYLKEYDDWTKRHPEYSEIMLNVFSHISLKL